MSTRDKVRVRFAPSPTGPLHMGGVRTALFNYLFAKKHGGDFLLRIEDTDQTRYVDGAEDYIIEALKWCGITPDEGAGAGGDFGPYRQSERKDTYKKYADTLIASGWAYYAFDKPEELDAARKAAEETKSVFTYNTQTRVGLKNSLTFTPEETQQRINSNEPYVIRFKMPENEVVSNNDAIRGTVSFNTNDLDDKVLFKSDGLPTYHLANVVDDYLMQISHVIRGEEWLPSLPLHVLLYKALGWESEMPVFAHLPLILKPVGKGKLSKRDGDKLGFPVFPLQWTDPKTNEISSGYREDGYLPEAFINMLAFLGWNPGTDQEIFCLEELCAAFSLERVGKSGSKFDPEKTKWFNQHYVQHMSNQALAQAFEPELAARDISVDAAQLATIIGMVKERIVFVKDIWEQADFLFTAPTEYDAKTAKKRWKGEVPAKMTELSDLLSAVEEFSSEHTESVVKDWIEAKEYGMGAIMNAFRLAIVGAGRGPHLFDIISIIGKDETIARLKKAVEVL